MAAGEPLTYDITQEQLAGIFATAEPATTGRKHDGGKSPIWQGLFQYFPRALREVGLNSKYGLEKYKLKYDDVNWLRVENGFERYSDGLGRHVLGEFIDGPIDPESGQLHATMVAWNALARLELLLLKIDEDKKKNEATT